MSLEQFQVCLYTGLVKNGCTEVYRSLCHLGCHGGTQHCSTNINDGDKETAAAPCVSGM